MVWFYGTLFTEFKKKWLADIFEDCSLTAYLWAENAHIRVMLFHIVTKESYSLVLEAVMVGSAFSHFSQS